MRVLAATLCVSLCLSGCSAFHSVFGGGSKKAQDTTEIGPKFPAPQYTGQGAPDLASVPGTAPAPPSTKHDREKTIEGLVADRERARYTDQSSRIAPVNVRPLSEAAAEAEDTPAAPPQAQGAPVAAVTKLQTPPGKSGADALAARANIPPPAPPPGDAADVVGPAAPRGAASAAGPRPSAALGVRSDGFRALNAYEQSGGAMNRVASIEFGVSNRSLTAADRRAVGDAVQLSKRGKGDATFRVIGRSGDASEISQARATAVARELQALGVAQDHIYVGTDSGSEGRVDVILDQ